MKVFQRIIGVSGLSNLGVVAEGKVYRSAQPDYSQARGWLLSIKSVLNLREEPEQEDVEIRLMKYFQLRLNIVSEITVDDFDLAIDTLSNPDNQPILAHCLSGADRTGIICAGYRIRIDGWTLAEAWEEAEAYGGGIHDILNLKLKYHLEAYAKAKGFPL